MSTPSAVFGDKVLLLCGATAVLLRRAEAAMTLRTAPADGSMEIEPSVPSTMMSVPGGILAVASCRPTTAGT
jgi:hypothetical protein